MNKLIAGAARRNRTYLPTAFQELTSRNWHIISGLRHPACKENFPRSRKLAFLRNVGTERDVLSCSASLAYVPQSARHFREDSGRPQKPSITISLKHGGTNNTSGGIGLEASVAA